MAKLSRSEALEKISNWSNDEIVALLRKNSLTDSCDAIRKRQIDGEEFLHLTEGKLTLWKNDLARPSIRSLWRFVEDVMKTPEKYVESKRGLIEDEGAISDTASWDTSFENSDDDSIQIRDRNTKISTGSTSSEFRRSLNRFETIEKEDKSACRTQTERKMSRSKNEEDSNDDSIYANCEPIEETKNLSFPVKNVSKLHGQFETDLAVKLRHELSRRSQKPIVSPKPTMTEKKPDVLRPKPTMTEKKPDVLRPRPTMTEKKPDVLRPKPESTAKGKKPEMMSAEEPKASFLHTLSKTTVPMPNSISEIQNQLSRIKGGRLLPPTPPDRNVENTKNFEIKLDGLPKPPMKTITLDPVGNLPSDDEYEAFDEDIIHRNQLDAMRKTTSNQSLVSGYKGSMESVYQPPSIPSHDENDEEESIYTSITEHPDENDYYLRPINFETPPPLPATRPGGSPTPSPTPSFTRPTEKTIVGGQLLTGLGTRVADEVADMIVRIKRGLLRCCYSLPPEPPERSPDKKSATLPHAGSNSSLAVERATRPLPPRPDKQNERPAKDVLDRRTERQSSYVDKPWYHNVDRNQAIALIRSPENQHRSYPEDGYFLLRPSTANPHHPLTLVLWYRNKVYNVPVRRRTDNRFALGSAKSNEQSFTSVEEIVNFYRNEELVLHSGGAQTGSTRLTGTPGK